MKNSASDRLGTEHREKDRRISILKHDLASTLTLPTPQNRLFAGRWV
jgi:hypothetical protein